MWPLEIELLHYFSTFTIEFSRPPDLNLSSRECHSHDTLPPTPCTCIPPFHSSHTASTIPTTEKHTNTQTHKYPNTQIQYPSRHIISHHTNSHRPTPSCISPNQTKRTPHSNPKRKRTLFGVCTFSKDTQFRLYLPRWLDNSSPSPSQRMIL